MKPQIVTLMSNNFSVKYRVYWEDTDGQGVVYYANYLKFAERARTELLRHLNLVQTELKEKEKIFFVVRKCEIEYFKSAKLDDMIEVLSRVSEVRNSSLEILQICKNNEEVLTSLKVQIVCIDSENMRPKKIPQFIKDLLLNV
jgi:acyl-CoA thioester hydrolase